MKCLFYLIAWPFLLAIEFIKIPFALLWGSLEIIMVFCLKLLEAMIKLPFYFLKWICDSFLAHNQKKSLTPRIDIESVSDYDFMEGHQFEYAIANLLEKCGYENVTVTPGSGDDGLDVIAYKNGLKIGFQCKCFSQAVGNKAVQEAFTGKTMYGCDHAVVVTNNYYTSSAINTARQTGIELWDRDKLNALWRGIARESKSFTSGTIQNYGQVHQYLKIAYCAFGILILFGVLIAGYNSHRSTFGNRESYGPDSNIVANEKKAVTAQNETKAQQESSLQSEDIYMKNIPIPDNLGTITLVAGGAYALEVTDSSLEDNCIPPGEYELIPVYPEVIKASDGESAAIWKIYISEKKIQYIDELEDKDYVGIVGGISQTTRKLTAELGQYIYVIDSSVDEKTVGSCEMCLVSEPK